MVSVQTFFIALADRTRRRLLNLMREHEICVYHFTEVLDVSQPKISRHLAYLRKAGLVSTRREGKWIYYRIIEPEDFYAAQILRDTLDWLKSQERMRKDYEKLEICALLTNPPKPDTLPQANVSYYQKEELETYLL